MKNPKPLKSGNSFSAADANGAVEALTKKLRSESEMAGDRGAYGRLMLATMPPFYLALDTARKAMLENGEAVGEGDSQMIGVTPDAVDEMLRMYVSLFGNMVAAVACCIVPCMSEPGRTCESCAEHRATIVDHVGSQALAMAKAVCSREIETENAFELNIKG